MPDALFAGLLAGIGLSGAAHVWAEYRGPRWQVYLFKPLTVLLISALAAFFTWGAASDELRRAGAWILAGLACSLAGDVFLMLPRDRFLAGLASFLVAHLCYIVGFAQRYPWRPGEAVYLAPFLAYAAVLLLVLWPHLGSKRVPVVCYAAALVIMAWRAMIPLIHFPVVVHALLLWGGCAFLLSDSLLAVNRFLRPFAGAQAAIMGTYYAAQLLIVMSLLLQPGGGPVS